MVAGCGSDIDGTNESVLYCLVGLSPAVLTETVWSLANEREAVIPDRIFVITTGAGRRRLQETFFATGEWENFCERLRKHFGCNLEGKLAFGSTSDAIQVIPEVSQRNELTDIRTDTEVEAVADFLLDSLRRFVENPAIRLVASLSGGRKTMSALLLSVMMLIGRSRDRIVHVTVDDPWERIPAFLYPGCKGSFSHPDTGIKLDSHDAHIQLADVPFVPLRYLFPSEVTAGRYMDIMKRLQRRVADFDSGLKVRVIPDKGELWINERHVPVAPREFAFMLYFASRVLKGEHALAAYDQFTRAELKAVTEPHSPANNFAHWAHVVFENDWEPKEDPRRIASSLRAKMKAAGLDPLAIDRLVPVRGRISMDLDPADVCIETSSD